MSAELGCPFTAGGLRCWSPGWGLPLADVLKLLQSAVCVPCVAASASSCDLRRRPRGAVHAGGLLELLAREKARATFFPLGEQPLRPRACSTPSRPRDTRSLSRQWQPASLAHFAEKGDRRYRDRL